MKYIYFLPFFILLYSCANQGNKNKTNTSFPDLKSYFQREIKWLDSVDPEIQKTVVEGEDPIDTKFDSVDWQEELGLFELLDLAAEGNHDKFEISIDSHQQLKTTHYIAKDTNQLIQMVSISENAGKTNLIEAMLKTRTFTLDRDTRLSYLPGRGYGVQISENYIWSKPKRREIFVEIATADFLRK